MAPRTWHFRIANDLAQLERIPELVDEVRSTRRLPDRTALELSLVLKEVLGNIITFGCADRKDHTIDMQMDLRPEELTVIVWDDGRTLKDSETPAPGNMSREGSSSGIGGLGIQLARRLMDTVSYGRDGERNMLRFAKHLEPGSDPL